MHRSRIVMAVVCAVTVLTLGAGWFAFGQSTNSAEPTPGMGSPLVRDVNLERIVGDLSKRVIALEATVLRLESELNTIKKKKP